MTRTRMDAWNRTRAEGDWPAVLVGYQQAVGSLRALDPQSGRPGNPAGWRFQAAIHGLATSAGRPDTSNPLWCTCQHGSWFFFPWHRMYLLAFELIVQDALDDDTWSLPYWNSLDRNRPADSALPPAFRDTTTGNNLHTPRRSVAANSGAPLPELETILIPSLAQALDAVDFSTATGRSTFGGGETSTPIFDGEELGLLENTPHGGVHVLVGNDYDQRGNPVRRGWMGSPYTAALDPIFWLHHANIDRLWQVWLNQDPAHRNPSGRSEWMDTEFSFPKPGGGLSTWKVGEVLDTVALGYEYESTASPTEDTEERVAAARPSGVAAGGREVTDRLPPQVLGATPDVPIASTEAVDVELSEPAGDRRQAGLEAAEASGGRVFLRIEGITGSAAAPVYDVYVNVPEGDDPRDHAELRAGALATFRLAETSSIDDVHDGSGLSVSFDITSVRDALVEQGRWDPGRLRVSFRPLVPSRPDDTPADAELEAAEATPADLRAARVSVLAG